MASVANFPGFRNLDDCNVYHKYDEALQQAETLNLAVEFDETNAYAALDLGLSSLAQFLENRKPRGTRSRWVSIWGPERQKDRIQKIAALYEFSPRLLGIICTDHSTPLHVDDGSRESDVSTWRSHKSKFAGHNSTGSHSQDPENHGQNIHLISDASTLDLNHYNIVNEVWHYCSVDWGSRCKLAS